MRSGITAPSILTSWILANVVEQWTDAGAAFAAVSDCDRGFDFAARYLAEVAKASSSAGWACAARLVFRMAAPDAKACFHSEILADLVLADSDPDGSVFRAGLVAQEDDLVLASPARLASRVDAGPQVCPPVADTRADDFRDELVVVQGDRAGDSEADDIPSCHDSRDDSTTRLAANDTTDAVDDRASPILPSSRDCSRRGARPSSIPSHPSPMDGRLRVPRFRFPRRS